jgi:hypothetical protein
MKAPATCTPSEEDMRVSVKIQGRFTVFPPLVGKA